MDFSSLIISIGMTPYTLLHILGVALGLGIATGMDFLLMRNVLRNSVLTETHLQSMVLLSRFVSAALVMLWLSGVGFLLCYSVSTPEKLLNPKIWSKLSIVFILTVNGFAIHHYILPTLRQCVGKTLLAALPYKTLAFFFMSGAISFVSWYFPFLYGTLPALNFAFSFMEFSVAYAMVIAGAVSAGLILLGFLYANMASKRLERAAALVEKMVNHRRVIPVPLRQRGHRIGRFSVASAYKIVERHNHRLPVLAR